MENPNFLRPHDLTARIRVKVHISNSWILLSCKHPSNILNNFAQD